MSGTSKWKEAWNEELSKGALTKYGAVSTGEGFAEFGRLLYTGILDEETGRKLFPKATKFFEENELLP